MAQEDSYNTYGLPQAQWPSVLMGVLDEDSGPAEVYDSRSCQHSYLPGHTIQIINKTSAALHNTP